VVDDRKRDGAAETFPAALLFFVLLLFQ